MSDSMAFHSPLAAEIPSHQKLRKLSHVLALMFAGIMALLALYVAALAGIGVVLPDHMLMGTRGVSIVLGRLPALYPGAVRLSQLPLITWLAGLAVLAMQLAPVFPVLRHLRGLFLLYASGTVFGRENALHLKRIGLWLIAYPFILLAGNALFLAAGGADRASWFHLSEIQAPVLGLIVLAIALVMEFGRDIEQEKDSFV